MILLRRLAVLTVGALAVATILFVGAYAYRALSPFAAETQAAKLSAENLLFVSIVGASVVILAVTLLLLRSWGIGRTLERAVELARLGSSAVQDALLRLGRPGRQFREVLRHLDDLSERRARKISALAAAVDLLLNNSRLPLLLCDATGKVTHASRGYLESEDAARGTAVGRPLGEIIDGLNFPALTARLTRERGVLLADQSESPRYLGIFDRADELSSVMCVFGGGELHVSAVTAPVAQRRRRLALGRFSDRRRASRR